MPVKSPFYELPEFGPTGNPDIDRVLDNWRRSFGASYTRNLFEAERVPFVQSTAGITGVTLFSTVAYATTLLVKEVGFQGAEDVQVYGNAYLVLQGSGTAAGLSQVITVGLFVEYPDGTTAQLTSSLLQSALDRATTITNLAGTYSQFWKPGTRIQMGGKHRFSLRGHKSTSGSNAGFSSPSMSIFAF